MQALEETPYRDGSPDLLPTASNLPSLATLSACGPTNLHYTASTLII